jgi:hypothetical protein
VIRAFHGGCPANEHIALVFSKYRLDGLSSARENRQLILREKRAFLESMDPLCSKILYKYWGSAMATSRSGLISRTRAFFDSIIHIRLTRLRVLARMGL